MSNKTWIFACIVSLIPTIVQSTSSSLSSFTKMGQGLNELCDWLANITVTMCDNGINRKYWIPVFQYLRATQISGLLYLYPKYTKRMKGIRPIAKNAKWILWIFTCAVWLNLLYSTPADIRRASHLDKITVFKLTCMITGEKNRAQNCLLYLI